MNTDPYTPISTLESASSDLYSAWNKVLDRVCSMCLYRQVEKEDAHRFLLVKSSVDQDPFRVLIRFDGEAIGYVTQSFLKKEEGWFFKVYFTLIDQE